MKDISLTKGIQKIIFVEKELKIILNKKADRVMNHIALSQFVFFLIVFFEKYRRGNANN